LLHICLDTITVLHAYVPALNWIWTFS